MAVPTKAFRRLGHSLFGRELARMGKLVQAQRRIIGGSPNQAILDTGLGPGMFDPTPPYSWPLYVNTAAVNGSGVYDMIVYRPDYSNTAVGGWNIGEPAWGLNLDRSNPALTVGEFYEGIFYQTFIVAGEERPLYRFRSGGEGGGVVVKLNNPTPNGDTTYDMTIQTDNGGLAWSNGANVWGINVRGVPVLMDAHTDLTNALFLAVAKGSTWNGRSVYVFEGIRYDPSASGCIALIT